MIVGVEILIRMKNHVFVILEVLKFLTMKINGIEEEGRDCV